jgi:hypothetical protein
MEKINHNKINSIYIREAIIQVYKNFLFIINTNDIFQNIYNVLYKGEIKEFNDLEKAISYINKIK